MSDLSRFLKQFDDMIDKLIEICNDNTSMRDLKVFKQKVELVKPINPQKIITAFIQYIYLPYRNRIMGEFSDFEGFISNANVLDEINRNEKVIKDLKANNVDNDLIMTKALNLKNMWSGLNDNNKNMLHTYFKVLVKLCDRYINSTLNK